MNSKVYQIRLDDDIVQYLEGLNVPKRGYAMAIKGLIRDGIYLKKIVAEQIKELHTQKTNQAP